MKHRQSYLATGRKIPAGWHIHHIIPRSEGGTDDASNLICLHPKMHSYWHVEVRQDKQASNGVFIEMAGNNKGNKASDETRRRMSKAQKGKTFSLETRKKLSISKTGTKHSEETKAQMSKDRKGKINAGHDNRGEKNPNFGNKCSDTTKAAISLANKGHSRGKGIPKSKEHRAALSKAAMGRTPWNKGKQKHKEIL